MTKAEWQQVHTKLNALYPHQQIPPETAAVWYEDLAAFDQGEIWLAIRRHGRTNRFAPTLAEILTAIDANDRDLADQAAAQRRALERRADNGDHGVPMPPETREALRILSEASRPDSGIDKAEARRMIDHLADQLEARTTPRQETVADATRTCPECASSEQAGFVSHPDGGHYPCPMCRPARHMAWERGVLDLKVDDQGYPAGFNAAKVSR